MDIWWNSIQFTALCWLAGFGKAKIFLKARNNCNRQWNTTFYNNSQIGYKVKEDSELERTSALLLEYSSGQTFDCSVERIRVDEATATAPSTNGPDHRRSFCGDLVHLPIASTSW